MLAIGYVVFWVELYLFDTHRGVTSPLATALFLLMVLWVVFRERGKVVLSCKNLIKNFREAAFFQKWFLITGGILAGGILFCALWASILPPHLMREYDALNYHLTIPRQHLILSSFQHIPWSTADLYLLPIDFALAPYWFVTHLPNKFPQFIFLTGLVFISMRLVGRFLQKENFWAKCLVGFAVLGSHHIGVQAGTAMIDLVTCYLFLAALDSFIEGDARMAAIEFGFFFWSKSFIPLQMSLIIFILVALFWVLKKVGFANLKWGFLDTIDVQKYRVILKKFMIGLAVLSVVIGGPFLAKSLYYAGTPFYPFNTGMVKINKNIDYESRAWHSLMEASQEGLKPRDAYGHGRSLVDFLKHFWLIAVPEDGVNNKFDYPVGLPYLLFLGPFLFLFGRSLQYKELSILPIFIILYWLTWWLGSQQSRFLYIPVLLMFILVAPTLKVPSNILMGAMMMALLFNAISIFRAHRDDFFHPKTQSVLREEDKDILRMNREYFQGKKSGYVDLDYRDVPYAQFPVRVTKEHLPFVIAY